MKDESDLFFSSFLLHPSSFILPFSSFLFHPSPFLLHSGVTLRHMRKERIVTKSSRLPEGWSIFQEENAGFPSGKGVDQAGSIRKRGKPARERQPWQDGGSGGQWSPEDSSA
jgi:hypothetical protein